MIHQWFRCLALPVILVICAACGRKTPALSSSGGAGGAAGVSGQPVVASPDAAHRFELKLEGGPFVPARELLISTAAPARLEVLPDGFRLVVPAGEGGVNPSGRPAGGLWLFAEGTLEEDATLELRTGTQLVIDGVSWAPAAKPKAAPLPTKHPLDAKLLITRFEPERGIFEAEFTATLLAPDGKSPVMATGLLLLPWPVTTP